MASFLKYARNILGLTNPDQQSQPQSLDERSSEPESLSTQTLSKSSSPKTKSSSSSEMEELDEIGGTVTLDWEKPPEKPEDRISPENVFEIARHIASN